MKCSMLRGANGRIDLFVDSACMPPALMPAAWTACDACLPACLHRMHYGMMASCNNVHRSVRVVKLYAPRVQQRLYI